ncbi:MAG: protein kinase [Proteobacteria bacterium]|nr:protein kinase [Pseudomonadota bacterium]
MVSDGDHNDPGADRGELADGAAPSQPETQEATLPTLPASPGSGPGPAASSSGAGNLPIEIDKFDIIKLLGQGGMGRVFLGRDRRLGRNVAIKEILAPNAVRRERFRREARAAALLQHQNIAAIYDDGEFEGRPYIVTEYVHGTSLAAIDKPMSWPQPLTVGTAIARGLAAAHRRGVIHRDIKPANIMLSDDGEPKLLDFGLARVLPVSRVESAAEVPTGRAPPRDHGSVSSLTQDGAIAGTPAYMAPELWQSEPASKASDVYSLGVILYELCAGRRPFGDLAADELQAVLSRVDPPALTALAPAIDDRFAAVIHRCLARRPEQRYQSGRDLLYALEALAPINRPLPQRNQGGPLDNPYPGLRPFDASLQTVFFGRDRDVSEVIERLYRDRLVIVAGSSGVGKSSLVHAGVIPRLQDRGLGDGRTWSPHTLIPDRAPLQALSAALAAQLDRDSEFVTDLLSKHPFEVCSLLRHSHGDERGTVIVVDQLEELVTVSDEQSAAHFSRAIAALVERTDSFRVIATVRCDKLTELVDLPGLGRLATTSFYLLRPIDRDGLRNAIVQPALHREVEIADDLVELLLAAGNGRRASLPLVQFALSQLWHARDIKSDAIRADVLDKIGGVEAALSRHADQVWLGLAPALQDAVRDILVHLVTGEGSRARRGKNELIGRDEHRRKALEVLVESRLITAGRDDRLAPVYELAHEALITGWKRLHSWLTEGNEILTIKKRLAIAAEDWQREGRAREYLWQGRQLRALEDKVIEGLTPLQEEFLRASRKRDWHIRWIRRTIMFLPIVSVVLAYGGFRCAEYREIRNDVDDYLNQADELMPTPTSFDTYAALRKTALDCFAADGKTQCEATWQQAISLAPKIDADLLAALLPLELALQRDARRADVRRKLVELYQIRTLLALRRGRKDAFDELVKQIERYDDSGDAAKRWHTNAVVTLETSPPGLPVTVNRYDRDKLGRLVLTRLNNERIDNGWKLNAGSYLLVIPGSAQTVEIRYPLWIPPGDSSARSIDLTLPAPEEIPPGYVYIPPGDFLFGYSEDSAGRYGRIWSQTLPQHKRRTAGFAIARHETTYGEWIEYLNDLSPEQREANLPAAERPENSVHLRIQGTTYLLEYRAEPFGSDNDQKTVRVRAGQSVDYPGRSEMHRSQNWLRFPVTGISGQQVVRYAEWLSKTGKVPRARLCREDEWERAARGADDRFYPHGFWLQPADANYDETYGRKPNSYGFDEVGIHPHSASPFGLHDMVGNAYEMAISIIEERMLAMRGGAYYFHKITGSSVNRDVMAWDQPISYVGFRLCADLPSRFDNAR